MADYSRGLSCGRYQAVSGRRLPFEDCHFDLALCADSMSGASKHSMLERITELCRVAQEVRLFPLLDRSGEIAEVFGPVMLAMQQANYGIEVKQVPDKKGQLETNAMLRIWAKACLVD